MKTCIGAGLCAMAVCAGAAQENIERFERTLQQLQRRTRERVSAAMPESQRAFIDYGGYFTLSYLSFDDAFHNNHGLRQYELVGYGRLNFDGVHEFYARGRSDYRDYNPGDAFAGQGDRLEGRVEEAWYRFDLQRFASVQQHRIIQGDVAFKAGRQFVDWGNGLTLDQYVDGATAEARYGPLSLGLLAGVTVRETIDFDISRPHFFDDTHRGFFGGLLTFSVGRQNPYVYALVQRDYNRDEPIDAHVIPTRYHYDSYYVGAGSNGALSDRVAYGGEFCFEGGHDLSNSFDPSTNQPVTQRTDRIEAYAAELRLDYLPNDARRTRFSAEAIISSGDTDRVNTNSTFGGNRPGTVDHAFNSLGVLYTGLAFTPPVSNLMVLRLGASTYPLPQTGPFKRLQAGTDWFLFAKTRRAAPIDEPTGDNRYLGFEPDFFVNWQLTDDVSLAVRYGLFVPGEAIPSGDQDHVRQFFYAGVTYAF